MTTEQFSQARGDQRHDSVPDGSHHNGYDHIEHLESLSPAEQLLVSFLAEHAGECTDSGGTHFEALCSEHPKLAAELRRLQAEWSRLDRVLGAHGASGRDGNGHDGKGHDGKGQHGNGHDAKGRARNGHAGAPYALPEPRIDSVALDELITELGEHGARRSRYRIEEELAHGGMGVIYKVWDPDLRRHVAMKSLRSRRSKLAGRDQEDRVRGRFLEEAQITGQLEHPGIVPVHELGVDADSRLFFTMPLVRGRELKQVIELAREGREGWNQTKALGVFLKVCEAVAYAHSKGVVHRDLKPSNVMVGRFGETYVMDWGLARVLGRADERDPRLHRHDSSAPPSELVDTDIRERLESTPDSPLITRDGAVIGTPPYMAPEQAEGRIEELGPRADVYSIGAMLYHLLTGQMPYVPSGSPVSPHTVLAARLMGPPKPVLQVQPDAAPELAAICEKAMSLDADERYASALDLAEDIEAFLGNRRVTAFDSSLSHVVKLAWKRNKKLALALAALLVLALVWGVSDVVKGRLHAADVRRTADFALAQVLRSNADQLWPATPERAPVMRWWLASVDDLLSRADVRRAELGVAGGEGGLLASYAANVDWLALERPRIATRLDQAETLVARTIDAHAGAWKAAIDSIASLRVYGGLRLAPQRGLIPLQLNPTSGLWEFWVEATGTEPRVADVATGVLALEPESALVLVLIPGGEFASSMREKITGEAGVVRRRTLTLAPYFIGRTEVPQCVWLRVMGSNPSRWQPPDFVEYEYTPLVPVEYVDWHMSSAFVARVDLQLPTEAQWERAARAGETQPTAYGLGDDIEVLAGRENVLDQSMGTFTGRTPAPFLDGFQMNAPVATFLANGFGLHDLLGNVAEWCADQYSERLATEGLRADGSFDHEPSRTRVFRGGSHYTSHEGCRLDLRQFDLPRGANHTRGLRVARPVQ